MSSALEELTQLRITDPGRALRAAQSRERGVLPPDGKLAILAADHPARRVTKVGDNPLGMANRQDYLSRILRVLSSSNIDGVMATMDVIEDLLVLDASLLDKKFLIASLNRGGLAGASWEMDDPVTGPSPASCAAWRLDGVKLLLRICDAEPASLRTMEACARAITEANAVNLPTFLEPLPVELHDGAYRVVKTAEALARIAGVASALGDSSRYLWLKMPYCDGYQTVAAATTLPILMLGGESAGDATPFLRDLSAALAAGPNVRGALVGRNVLYPGPDDPLAVADAAGAVVHKGWTMTQAIAHIQASRGKS